MTHGIVGLMAAAIGGYWVLERASTHKRRLRQVGQLVGGLIIVVSLGGVACSLWCLATGKAGYGRMGKKGYCPFMSKTAPLPDTPETAQ